MANLYRLYTRGKCDNPEVIECPLERQEISFDSVEKFEEFASLLPLPQTQIWALVEEETAELVCASRTLEQVFKGMAMIYGDDPVASYIKEQQLYRQINEHPGFSFTDCTGAVWKIRYLVAARIGFPVLEMPRIAAIAEGVNAQGDALRPVEYRDIGDSELNPDQEHLQGRYTSSGAATTKNGNTLLKRFKKDLGKIIDQLSWLQVRRNSAPQVLPFGHPLWDHMCRELILSAEQETNLPVAFDRNLCSQTIDSEGFLRAAEAIVKEHSFFRYDRCRSNNTHFLPKNSRGQELLFHVNSEASLAEIGSGLGDRVKLLEDFIRRYNGEGAAAELRLGPENGVYVVDRESGRTLTCFWVPATGDPVAAFANSNAVYWRCTAGGEEGTLSPALTAHKEAQARLVGSPEWFEAQAREIRQVLPDERIPFGDGKYLLSLSYNQSPVLPREGVGMFIAVAITEVGADRPEKSFSVGIGSDVLGELSRRYNLCSKPEEPLLSYRAWVVSHPDHEPILLDDAIKRRLEVLAAQKERLLSQLEMTYRPCVEDFLCALDSVAASKADTASIELPVAAYIMLGADKQIAGKIGLEGRRLEGAYGQARGRVDGEGIMINITHNDYSVRLAATKPQSK